MCRHHMPGSPPLASPRGGSNGCAARRARPGGRPAAPPTCRAAGARCPRGRRIPLAARHAAPRPRACPSSPRPTASASSAPLPEHAACRAPSPLLSPRPPGARGPADAHDTRARPARWPTVGSSPCATPAPLVHACGSRRRRPGRRGASRSGPRSGAANRPATPTRPGGRHAGPSPQRAACAPRRRSLGPCENSTPPRRAAPTPPGARPAPAACCGTPGPATASARPACSRCVRSWRAPPPSGGRPRPLRRPRRYGP
mmetsp:Transcript_8588/g.24724  ORF Transcript_8588/g.24724 Transcript_8588/m.24724 type:complete len:257 (-) Transcript_8588:429-1199(-)